jgi:hypothetical protein
MIVSKIQGGIGNQMFQWAYGRYLSIKYQKQFYVDKSFYSNQQGNNVVRRFELEKFNFKPIDISETKIETNLKFFRVLDDFKFKEISISSDFNYYLDGYWQSEKYFIDIKDKLLLDFSPSVEIENKLKSNFLGKTVSLHIRRTDYVTSNGYHPVQNLDYYNKALESLGAYDRLIIFSDDVNWCKLNLKFNNMIFCEIENDLHQLWLMSLCHDNIIANSTFSWWAAWLNKNPNKKVIAPKLWFGQQTNIDSSDIIPDSWIKI